MVLRMALCHYVIEHYHNFWEFKTIILDSTLSSALMIAAMILVGMTYCKVRFSPITNNPGIIDITVLITLAIGLVVECVPTFIFTEMLQRIVPEFAKSSKFGLFIIPQSSLYALIFEFFMIVGLYLFLWYTLMENAIKVTMQNRNAVPVIGMNAS